MRTYIMPRGGGDRGTCLQHVASAGSPSRRMRRWRAAQRPWAAHGSERACEQSDWTEGHSQSSFHGPRRASFSFRWQVPPGNVLQTYLEACERHGVVANSGVTQQLLKRARAMQALPYHLILHHDRSQLFETLEAHMDPSGSGKVSAVWAERALCTLNPRIPWREALYTGDADAEAEYRRYEQKKADLKAKDKIK
jgi:hypothetical protein